MIGDPHFFAVRSDTHGNGINASWDAGHDLFSSRVNDIQGIGRCIDDKYLALVNSDGISMRAEKRRVTRSGGSLPKKAGYEEEHCREDVELSQQPFPMDSVVIHGVKNVLRGVVISVGL